MDNKPQPIIIKKVKGHGHGHHGGAWKVAFADFTTAMMAFFLLLWILQTTTEEQKRSISGYFTDPGGALIGPGGASPGVVNLEKPMKEPNPPAPKTELSTGPEGSLEGATGPEDQTDKGQSSDTDAAKAEEALRKKLEQQEQQQLDALKNQLEQQLSNMDSVFQLLKDQILIDFTALGLRIQIVDKEQRPMFDTGSARLKPYSEEVLKSLAGLLDKVPNKISVSGHTDAKPYGTGASYTNWELSTDRANAARRALLDGDYPEDQVATVQGMGASAPLLPDMPMDPINRRITIIVLKKAVADALTRNTGVDAHKLLHPGEGGEDKPLDAPNTSNPFPSAPIPEQEPKH